MVVNTMNLTNNIDSVNNIDSTDMEATGKDLKRILYVEDNEDIANVVSLMLGRAGFKTDIALTGKEGITKAYANSYNLVMLDVMLPDMSGWDVYREIKRHPVQPKYVFLSIIPISNVRLAELKKEGVLDYINKPFSQSELVKRISDAFAQCLVSDPKK